MTLRIRVCAVLALLACAWGCGASQSVRDAKIEANLTQAAQSETLGKTAEARQWADRAIAVAPDDVSVYAPDPIAYSIFGTSAPDETHTSVGVVFLASDDNAAVVDYMTRAVRKFPKSERPLYLLVQAQKMLGDTASVRANAAALAALLEARIARPGVYANAGLLDALAQAYFDAGDASKGAATYRRVIATYPFSPQTNDARNGLAYSYAVAGDTAHLPEALTLAMQALKAAQDLAKQGKLSDDGVAAVQDTVGWVQYQMGDYAGAVANLQQAMNGSPRSAENRYHLGMAYLKAGQTEAARAELSRAVLLSPGYADAAAALTALPAA